MPNNKKKNGNGNGDVILLAGRKFHIHPDAKIIPPMRDDEYAALKEDIKEHNGIRQKILIKGKFILDGIHRARAARELGIKKIPFEHFLGGEDKVFGEIVSRNVHRRHLTDKQRLTLIAWGRAPELKEEAKARQAAGKAPEKEGEEKEETGEAADILAAEAESGKVAARQAIDIVTQLPESEVRKVIAGKRKFGEAGREARKRRLKATGQKTTRKPKVVDKLAPEYINKRFGMFLKHWSHEQHRAVRKHLREFLK